MNFDVDNQALCQQTDPEIYYPDQAYRKVTQEMVNETIVALDLCQACPIQPTCLQFAINNREAFGIWGGTMPHERDKMAKLPSGQPLALPFYTRLREAVLAERDDLVCPDLPEPDPDFVSYDPVIELGLLLKRA